ncbi:MAG: transposase family protein [Candidatus Nitrosocosmicus sp.]
MWITTPPDLIIHKANHKKGCSRHDYDIYKKNHPTTPKQVVNMFDLGYLLVGRTFKNKYHFYHIKRKGIGRSSIEEKEYNKSHSKKRIVIEHTSCMIKKYRMMSDVFRNKLRNYDKVLDIVSGLIKYRIINQHQ